MTRISLLASATALAALAGPALAQTDTVTAGADRMGGGTPDEVLCSQVVTMDTATLPAMLYFIAGYGEGRDAAMGGSPGAAGMDASGGLTAGAGGTAAGGTGTDATAGAAAGATDGSGTMAEGAGAATGGEAPQSTDLTANVQAGGTDGAGAGAAGGTDPVLVGMTGFFEVPVERVVQVCTDNPERAVSDVLEEERRASGQGGN